MDRWLRLSEKAFPATEFGSDPCCAEAWVGPIPGLFTDQDLDAFRSATEDDARTFERLVEHPLHRHIVKLVVLATRHVPEWLVHSLLRAACLTVNPSFNRHFVAPCLLRFGRRRVVSELIEIARRGSDQLKIGATNALYWGAIAREDEMWPDAQRYEPFDGPPDEPVDDLLEQFAVWAVREFLINKALDVRRVLVHHIASASVRDTEQGGEAIDLARRHPDEFIRARLHYDLGESALIPALPHRGEAD
jgi:hypothetical protein